MVRGRIYERILNKAQYELFARIVQLTGSAVNARDSNPGRLTTELVTVHRCSERSILSFFFSSVSGRAVILR
jgi:hypothetical protein